MVDEKFRIECENMFGRNLERIEALKKKFEERNWLDWQEWCDVVNRHCGEIAELKEWRTNFNKNILPYISTLEEVLRDSIYTSRNAFLQIKAILEDSDLMKASTVTESYTKQLEKLDTKKEYIASLNDPKAFEAINLGVLKRERKDSEKKDYDVGRGSGDDVLDMKKGQNPQLLCERCKFESNCPHSHADTIDKLGCNSFEEKTKEQILKEFEKRLNEPIPNFWKASIKLGKTTEYDYYAKTIPNQLFIRRQKIRLIERFIKGLKEPHSREGLIAMWNKKLKQIREGK